MTSRVVAGFLAGIALIAIAIASVPFLAEAQSGPPGVTGGEDCRLATVKLDEGYGVSRTGLRAVCDRR